MALHTMLYHQRELAAGQAQAQFFSFTCTSDGKGHATRTQQLMARHDYHRGRRSSGSHEDSSNHGGLEFQLVAEGEKGDDDLGATFQQLWKVTSPNERSMEETIAKYQKEMMEMIRDVPESAYELSLRDMVELPKTARAEKETSGRQMGQEEKKKKKKKKKKKGRKQVLRSENLQGSPFLLNMFLPTNFGWRKPRTAGSRVSPKPMRHDEKFEVEKTMNTESRNSRTNSSRRGSKTMSDCFSFFCTSWSRSNNQP